MAVQTDTWQCHYCTYMNNVAMPICGNCRNVPSSTNNPYLDQALINTSIQYSPIKNDQYIEQHTIDINDEKEEISLKYWKCELCKTINNQHLSYCENTNCYAVKDTYTDLPVCVCGETMTVSKSGQCYKQFEYEICDICNNKIPPNTILYHCASESEDTHLFGFDICILCKNKYKHRLRYFVALIICPDSHSKDAYKLGALFTNLGFHKIEYLKGQDVTKQSVYNALEQLLPQNNEESNQFTAICYSGYGEWNNDEYYFALDPNDAESWISGEYIKQRCKPTANSKIIHDNDWNKTYYRHNALLLINSCHRDNETDPNRITKSLISNMNQQQNEHQSIFVVSSYHKENEISRFIDGCNNFVNLYLSVYRDKSLKDKSINPSSPIMLFRYLQESLNNMKTLSFDRIAETFLIRKDNLPEKALILERKMEGAFGIFGKSVDASHEYIVITDPNTKQRIRTELRGQNIKHIYKHPSQHIKVKITQNIFKDEGKTYEKYILDIVNYPNLECVKKVIHEIAKDFEFKSYNLTNRNCQNYGSVLTAKLYGISIEYVRIKDIHLIKKIKKVKDGGIKVMKAVKDYIHT